ncbi:RNA dependent RNA polymerase [Phanerochaete sordida]|uniref:RNA-dependent RNA polymerase n=1 Tax=Phanerochaete sordida TaxID=48140 RepID=A0A9P3GUV6_9APHY|nr:RNA dependent RNA polymerase [Phanerochaete sordida]
MPPADPLVQMRRSPSSESLASVRSQCLSETSSQMYWEGGLFDNDMDTEEYLRLLDDADKQNEKYYLPKDPTIWSQSEQSPATDTTPPTTPEVPSQSAQRGTKRVRDDDDDGGQPVAGPSKLKKMDTGLGFTTASTHNGSVLYSKSEGLDCHPVIIGPLLGDTHYNLIHAAGFCIQWKLLRYQKAGLKLFDIAGLHELLALTKATNVTGVDLLEKLVGSKDAKQMENDSPSSREKEAKDPCKEADMEFKHITSCSGPVYYLANSERNGWCGGKIHYTIKATSLRKGLEQFEVEEPVLATSDQLSRRYGSHSIIRLRIHKDDIYKEGKALKELCLRPFVVGGHVYRAFSCKEHVVRLIMTDERVQTIPSADTGASTYQVVKGKIGQSWCSGIDFLEFLRFYNDPQLNSEQSMAKWAVRFYLGSSTSIPAMRLAPERLHHISDIVSEAHTGDSKPKAENVMTDGCGLANYDFFHALQQQFNWPQVPVAVQMRVNGSKGLLLLHPNHKQSSPGEEPGMRPEVWIRASQRKIKYPANVDDPALFTVDILRSAHLTYPASLSTETIINLTSNGVKAEVIMSMMKTNMQEKVDGLTTWEGDKGIFRLWSNLAHEGGVISARLAREHPTFARVQGWAFDDYARDNLHEEERKEDDDADEALNKLNAQSSSAWWPDLISGSPSSLEETCMALLDSGFDPDSLPVLRAKMVEVAKKANKVALAKYNVRVPMSCSAWAVPDPCGVLEPGEIYIQSSVPLVAADGVTKVDVVVGSVLITRHPCKVPSDVQKVTAVDRHELHGYKDVIVVSTKGHRVGDKLLDRHLLSMLGGGDYDGDRVQVYWHPDLVRTFRHADPQFATRPKSVEDSLQESVESVKSFLKRVPDTAPRHVQIREIQRALLGPLENASQVGKYSTFWEVALYKYGYDSPEAIRLAGLFCAVLDGSKTGVAVKQQQWQRDQASYRVETRLEWKEPIVSAGNRASFGSRDFLRFTERSEGLRRTPFVMDEIRKFLAREHDRLTALILQRLGDPNYIKLDDDLAEPWYNFKARVEQSRKARKNQSSETKVDQSIDAKADQSRRVEDTWMGNLLEAIKKGVKTKREEWAGRRNLKASDESKEKGAEKGKGKANAFTGLRIEKRQDVLRACSKSFHSLLADLHVFQLSDRELLRYIASYAYIWDHETTGRWTRFPWDVAFRVLCEIKAEAVTRGNTKTTTAEFYYKMTINKRSLEGL